MFWLNLNMLPGVVAALTAGVTFLARQGSAVEAALRSWECGAWCRCGRGNVVVDLVETPVGTVAYRRAGAGAALVLLHGGLSDGRSWAPQLASLAEEYDVVAWDAPGCGGSADPAAELRLADYADAVAALARALGAGPVHLAGHSFGAGLAIDVYARHRPLVRSLVLSGAYAGWRGSLPPAEVEARLDRVRAELGRPPEEWADAYLAGLFARSVPRETLQAARTMLLDVRPAGARSMATAFAAADLRPVLPAIAVPALLIYGAEDARAPRTVAEALHAAIPGSQLILVPAAGHDVNLEAPQQYNAAVCAFLRTVGDPAQPPTR
jgi:pimeloyl-ACP methyl ester carboxylesterase